MNDNSLLNVGEVAKLLSTSERFILDKIRDGKLKAYLVGKSYTCFYSDVLAFVRSCPTAKGSEVSTPVATMQSEPIPVSTPQSEATPQKKRKSLN